MVLAAGPASATVVDPTPLGSARTGSNTEMVLSGLGPGTSVTGFIANSGTAFDPTAGYPTANPGAGWTAKNESFAGIIHATPVGGGATLNMYCIDILTETNIGVGYQLGTWDAANVPNVGFVARVLEVAYPNTDEPAALTDLNQKAAAVQATIWFFSDRYVLNTGDPLYQFVAALANQVIGLGPVPTPTAPTLTITPSTVSAPVGTLAGPFTVTSNAATTVTALGADMFSDAGGTVPIANGATVSTGAQIWLGSTGGPAAVLRATAVATVPSGNVYLYDGNTPGKAKAQKLILAQSATLTTSVQAAAEFQPPGQLVVTKTIGGPGAGQQGQIVIEVTCDGVALPPFVIPAGTPAGSVSNTYPNLPAGATCRVVETADGRTPSINVRVAGSGGTVTIPSGGSITVPLSDTYDTGSLIVNKTITGDAAGQQGAVTISVACNAGPAQPDFVIPAGTAAGTVSASYTGILAGAVCNITETANGATATITVVTQGSPQAVTLGAGGTGTADIVDVYDFVPGSLVVSKTVTGSAAGQQGLIGILVGCGRGNLFGFVVPAGTPAGSTPRAFDGIPAGSTCTVAEVINGSTTDVAVASAGSGQQVAVTPGSTGSAEVVNAVEPASVAPTMPETLPGTGGGSDAGNVLLASLAAAAVGAVLVLLTRRRAS
jgi:hypothetical protein